MPLFNSFLRDYPAALPPYDANLCISVPMLIPVIIGALELRAHSVHYSEDSAFGAVQALREIQVSVIQGIPTLDALYRLLNTSIRGVEYEELGPENINPPIAPYVDFEFGPNGILGKLHALQAYAANLNDGTTDGVYTTDDRNFRQQLEDILAALEAGGTLDGEEIELLGQILAAIGPVA